MYTLGMSAGASQILRYLRIGWSITCLLAVVFWSAMWARSYRWSELCDIAGHIEMSSFYGSFRVNIALPPYSFLHDWYFSSNAANGWFTAPDSPAIFARESLYRFSMMPGRALTVPHWFCVLLCGVFAVIPNVGKFKTRFSLRTLLIVTTLVAAALGLTVWEVE